RRAGWCGGGAAPARDGAGVVGLRHVHARGGGSAGSSRDRADIRAGVGQRPRRSRPLAQRDPTRDLTPPRRRKPAVSIPTSLLGRLETQLEALDPILCRATPAMLDARPRSDEWSARENLAHLARHQAVFLDRLRRLLTEDRPALGRYRAEEDAEWPAWAGLPADEAVGRLRALRRQLVALARSLSPAQSARTGLH